MCSRRQVEPRVPPRPPRLCAICSHTAALKLLAPVVLEDSPVAAGGPAYNVTHIPSVRCVGAPWQPSWAVLRPRCCNVLMPGGRVCLLQPLTASAVHAPAACSAAVAVAAVSSQQDHAVDGPVPPRVRQLCALRLPELLLQRLSKPDAPRADLGALLELLSDLSFALSGWVRPGFPTVREGQGSLPR